MFRKFQEFTYKFFYDENVASGVSHDDLGATACIYVICLLGEIISTISCFIYLFSDGLNNITIPWLIATAMFWLTMVIACIVDDKGNISRKTKYDNLTIEQKRFIFKMSILLFIHLTSCGIMVIAFPIMIIAGIFNFIFDGLSKLIFPEPVKKKTSKDLSSQFDNIIKD